MDSPTQIDEGSSKRNEIIPFKFMSCSQKMFSNPQIHHKSTPGPNFHIVPPPFSQKTCPTSHHFQNAPKTMKFNLKMTKQNIQKENKEYLVDEERLP